MTSYEKRYILRNRAIDEFLTDPDAFRDTVTLACGDFVPDDRRTISRIKAAMPHDMKLFDMFHDTLLSTLQRMTSKTKNRQLHTIISDSYLLDTDEVALVTTSLLEKRVANLINEFIEQTSQQLPSDKIMTVRDNAHRLLDSKTASELDELYSAYITYEAYTDVAQHCLISYVDPYSSRHEQRAAAAHITREQATYSESLKQRRHNISYRITQISHIYDGLVEAAIANGWTAKQLTAIRESYNPADTPGTVRLKKNPAIIESFIEATRDVVARETTQRLRTDELSLRVAISEYQMVEAHMAHLLNLTPVQFAHLPAILEEYRSLLTEQTKVKKRR